MTDYFDREEWDYSHMKNIIDHGIDVAVAIKRNMMPKPSSKRIDLGQLAHMILLKGDDCYVLKEDSGFEKFLTKAAKAWRDEQLAKGKTIIDRVQWGAVCNIVDNVTKHSRTPLQLKSDYVKHEVEMFATIDDVGVKGKADALIHSGDKLVITDLKTSAEFDRWNQKTDKFYPHRMHYDLQAALYLQIANAHYHTTGDGMSNFYFCVAETVPPYRVQYHHASLAFLESGLAKLQRCIEEIKKFGDREPNFLIEEVGELGDFSL